MGKSLSQVVKKYAKYDLLVLDEWLMYEMTDKEKQFISELMEIRYDKCSTISVVSIHQEIGMINYINQH